jgi:methionyl-tRNA formyltransferase
MDALVRHALPGSRLEVVPTTRDHGEDAWMPSLLKRAQLRGWPAHDRVEASGLGSEDVLISLQYDRIIDCDQLGGARAYNVHFAPLPRYRGSLTSALTVRNGEQTTAVTLHELVAEVDAGTIIAAQPFEVPPF